jgi:hypothetical protein
LTLLAKAYEIPPVLFYLKIVDNLTSSPRRNQMHIMLREHGNFNEVIDESGE